MKVQPKPMRLITASLLTSMLYGCGLSGTWPNLSDEIPDASERVRVIERAAVTAPSDTETAPVLSAENAVARIEDITKDILTAQNAYLETLNKYETAPTDDSATINHLWFEAQLSLTRYSQTISALDEIIFNESLQGTPVIVDATKVKNTYTVQVVAERQKLERIKPAQTNG